MCTVVILRRPDHDWPVLLAANRDEMATRPWRPPARHWRDRPNVTAGLDEMAGGTWLGVNDEGVVAGILNRKDSLGPDPRLRSRGELVLEALDHGDAIEAAKALGHLDNRSFRSFNMVIADNRDAYWLRSLGPPAGVEVMDLPPGLSMITAFDRNDPASPRTRFHLPHFEAAPPPDPPSGDWSSWVEILADRGFEPGAGPPEAMTVVTAYGFETLSSSLIALPAPRLNPVKPLWRFAAGRPDEAEYREIGL